MKPLIQLSNKVFCDAFLNNLNIQTKLLSNPYYDYPFLYIKNFFVEERCKEIVLRVQKESNYEEAFVRQKDIHVKKRLNKKIRDTKIYKLNDLEASLYTKKFAQYQPQIEEYFKLALTTASKTQLLEYTKGSFYKAHSDDSNMVVDKDKKLIGFTCVAPNRKVTSVLFLSQYAQTNSSFNFDGGELLFNYLYDEQNNPITLKPNMGDMLVFLSNPYFTHEVLPVKQGYRLSLVQWHDAIV